MRAKADGRASQSDAGGVGQARWRIESLNHAKSLAKSQIGARRPFDICELFDIVDARQAQSRRNLTSYFRQRAQGAVGPAAQARTFAAATATQLQLPSLTGSNEDVP